MRTLPELYTRYLRVLGIDMRPSGLEGLGEIVRRHLCRVPFENVSKLVLVGAEGAGRVTTLPEFLDGIEHRDLGGTCYTNNPFLTGLLRALGYDASLFGADMSNPNVHTSIRVRLGTNEYHVDVGYGAPFRQPIPLDRLPHEFIHGGWRFVFDRNARGVGHEMAVFSGSERVHGYVAHGPAREFGFFRQTILDSYQPAKTFMRHLRITRFFEEHAAEVRNRMLIRYRGATINQTRLGSMAELQSAVADCLMLPRCPVERAIEVIERMTGTPFFEDESCPAAF